MNKSTPTSGGLFYFGQIAFHAIMSGTGRRYMRKLFQKDRTNIGRYISNKKELDEKSIVKKMHIPKFDRPVEYYSLPVIIAAGYRAMSQQG